MGIFMLNQLTESNKLFSLFFNLQIIRMAHKEVLGIDFGGSGIKGAPVHVSKGKLLEERYRIPTPNPSSPEKVGEVISEIVSHFNWKGNIGIAFPAAVVNGVIKTASNIDKSWINLNANEYFTEITGRPTCVVNDADAAGIAEMKFGAGEGFKGSVILITVGTGIGTVLFTRGKLVPNTELGHIFLENGMDAEDYAADSVRKKEELSWEDWAKRFNTYLKTIEKLFYPELIIIGGGMSKKQEKFEQFLTVESQIVMAETRNEAGIIGAAIRAKKLI